VLKKIKMKKTECPAVSIGILRLDYDYPIAPGDIDSPDSFSFPTFFRVVPGLTFAMCQKGELTPKVKKHMKRAVDFLINEKKVSVITGDCGFMFNYQEIIRNWANKIPVVLSGLQQLSVLQSTFGKQEKIIVMTANGDSMKEGAFLKVMQESGVAMHRIVIVGCQDVVGFDAVAVGGKVDFELVNPGMVKIAQENLDKDSSIAAILLECTELPQFADSLRVSTKIPVFDAITGIEWIASSRVDNKLFGVDFEVEVIIQEEYWFGKHLSVIERIDIVNKDSLRPIEFKPKKKQLDTRKGVPTPQKQKASKPTSMFAKFGWNCCSSEGEVPLILAEFEAQIEGNDTRATKRGQQISG